MANKFQIKRTTVSGRTPNTTNSGNSSYIDAGELAVNLTDGKLFSSNGSAYFEVGANLALLAVGNTTVTGFINVSSTANVGGLFNARANAVVNGTFTVANTAELGNTTVTGFANISSTLAAGNTTVTGFANITSTLASGNTTVTGFANISSTLAAGNTTVTGFINVSSTATLGNTTINSLVTIGNTTVNTVVNSSTITVSSISANGGVGSNGQVLTSNGSTIYWANSTGGGGDGITVTDDTSTNSTHYPVFVSVTGSSTNAKASSTKLQFNPSTGILSATELNSLSDEKFKKNVIVIENATDIIKLINGVEFEWIENGRKSAGLIAQWVEVVLPHLVDSDANGNKTINYSGLIAYLIQSVKELNDRVKKLESE